MHGLGPTFVSLGYGVRLYLTDYSLFWSGARTIQDFFEYLLCEEHKKYQKFYFRFNRFWRECFEFEMLSPKFVQPEMKFLLLFVVSILQKLL